MTLSSLVPRGLSGSPLIKDITKAWEYLVDQYVDGRINDIEFFDNSHKIFKLDNVQDVIDPYRLVNLLVPSTDSVEYHLTRDATDFITSSIIQIEPYTEGMFETTDRSREYLTLIKSLYALKGTMRGIKLILRLLGVQYKDILEVSDTTNCKSLVIILDDQMLVRRASYSSIDYNPVEYHTETEVTGTGESTYQRMTDMLEKLEYLNEIYMPISCFITGVTNCSDYVGYGKANYNLGPSKLSRSFVLGFNKLSGSLGNMAEGGRIGAMFCRTEKYEMFVTPHVSIDYAIHHISSIQGTYSPHNTPLLSNNLVLSVMPLPDGSWTDSGGRLYIDDGEYSFNVEDVS